MQEDLPTSGTARLPLRLTLFPLSNPDAWHLRIGAALDQVGHRSHGGASQLQTWDPARATRLAPDLYVNIGWSLRKTWLNSGRHGLTTLPRKLYFSDPSALRPIAEREDVILNGRSRPALPRVDAVVGSCLELAGLLAKQGAIESPEPVAVEKTRDAAHRQTQLRFGATGCCPGTIAEKDITAALRRHGPNVIPAGFRISIVTDRAESAAGAAYETHLREWLRTFRLSTSGDTDSIVQRFTLEHVTERLQKRLAENDRSEVPGRAVLVALSGKSGDPLPPQQARLVSLLEQLAVPFRCFSLDNDDLKWSSRSQLMSLLQAAGGVPYAIRPPMPPGLQDVVFIGVDLGHPKNRDESWLVVSLVDRNGSLVGAWKRRQARDETASRELLSAALAWARAKSEQLPYTPKGVVVLRDGRLHAGERVATYYEYLGPNTTLVEVTKYDNPAMFVAEPRIRFAPAGSVVQPDGAAVQFLCPTGEVLDGQGVPSVIKIQLRNDCDGLGLGRDSMTDIVAGLVCAPSLGTKAHALPGPIYWADGIARSAPHSYKFAGLPIE